jgi:hypothetical protein
LPGVIVEQCGALSCLSYRVAGPASDSSGAGFCVITLLPRFTPCAKGFYRPPILKIICENARGRSLYVCARFRYVRERGLGVLFRLFVLAEIVMVGRLMMMVGGSVRISGGLMMVLTGRMPR